MNKSKSKDKPLNLKKLEPHALGFLFPQLNDHDYHILCDSIKAHGLMESIVLYEGAILDGNNRYSACKKVRVEPTFRTFDPNKEGVSAFDFVLQKNLARRNLTPSQASAIAADLAGMLKKSEEEAAVANGAGENSGSNSNSKSAKKRAKGDKAAKAAKALGVSRTSVKAAEKLQKEDPAAFKDVKDGKKTLNAATTETAAKKTKTQIASEEFEALRVLVGKVYGQNDAVVVEKKLPAKDFAKLAGLDEDEMIRIKPFLLNGWTLKAAIGWKSTQPSMAHTVRQITELAISSGKKTYEVDLGEWTLVLKRKAVDPDAE